jgi:DNA-binding beta-propeller fold protein YncE
MLIRDGKFAHFQGCKQSSPVARLFWQGGMRMTKLLPGFPPLAMLICASAFAQQVPLSTDLPSHPFFIKATWFIGGAGNWDYLTYDRDVSRLYIAHGTLMQVVDVETGSVVGEIKDLYEARQVALDDTGQFGYVTDGGQGKVVVFDRQTLKRVVDIDTGANPRWIVFDPLTHLVFVVRANPPGEAPPAPPPTRRRNTGLGEPPPPAAPATPKPPAQPQESNIQSFVTVIDAQTQTKIGEIRVSGQLGYAVVDESGQIYIAMPDRNQVARIDAAAVAAAMRPQPAESSPTAPADAQGADSAAPATAEPKEESKPKQPPFILLDWTGVHRSAAIADGRLRIYPIGPECNEPRALAIDERHLRIFAACTNRTLEVLNTGTGDKVTSLPIGPGADAVGYDQDHGLIFTSNGGAEGNMTIIRQDVTDSYNVIQTLPTRQRANILAVNPQSGVVYLVTDYQGVDLSSPGGIGTLKEKPVEGSFQVVKVEN